MCARGTNFKFTEMNTTAAAPFLSAPRVESPDRTAISVGANTRRVEYHFSYLVE